MTTTSKPQSVPSHAQCWRQFSLRSLMVLTLLCCVGLALWTIYVEPYRRQQRLAARIVGLKGEVGTEAVPTFWSRLFGEEFFVNIVRITAEKMPVDDEWMVNLRDTPMLRHLYVPKADISDSGLAHLARLEHLQGLDVGGTRISDAGLAAVQGLHRLQHLGVRNTRVSDAGLALLVNLHRLKGLELASCPITDAGLAHLAALADLEHLDLRDTGVTDAGIARLVSLKKLTTLQLDNTEVTEASLAHFQQLPVLQNVSAAGSHILPAVLHAAFPSLEERIVRRALTDRTVIEFIDTPMQDVVDYLKDYHKIEIQLNRRKVNERIIKGYIPVTQILRGKSLREALDVMLPPLELKHVIRYGVLMITTKDDADAWRPRLVLKPGEDLSRQLSTALYANTPIEFVETPLSGICGYLSDMGIPMHVAEASLDPADPLVTHNSRISAGDALELLFYELDLHGVIENNTIHVHRGPVPD